VYDFTVSCPQSSPFPMESVLVRRPDGGRPGDYPMGAAVRGVDGKMFGTTSAHVSTRRSEPAL